MAPEPIATLPAHPVEGQTELLIGVGLVKFEGNQWTGPNGALTGSLYYLSPTRAGSVVVTNGDATSKLVTFAAPMPNTSYEVLLTAQGDLASNRIWPATKTVDGFTITLAATLPSDLTVSYLAAAK